MAKNLARGRKKRQREPSSTKTRFRITGNQNVPPTYWAVAAQTVGVAADALRKQGQRISELAGTRLLWVQSEGGRWYFLEDGRLTEVTTSQIIDAYERAWKSGGRRPRDSRLGAARVAYLEAIRRGEQMKSAVAAAMVVSGLGRSSIYKLKRSSWDRERIKRVQ